MTHRCGVTAGRDISAAETEVPAPKLCPTPPGQPEAAAEVPCLKTVPDPGPRDRGDHLLSSSQPRRTFPLVHCPAGTGGPPSFSERRAQGRGLCSGGQETPLGGRPPSVFRFVRAGDERQVVMLGRGGSGRVPGGCRTDGQSGSRLIRRGGGAAPPNPDGSAEAAPGGMLKGLTGPVGNDFRVPHP